MSNRERRRHPRITAFLPLRLIAVGGKIEADPIPLLTLNISKAGLCFPLPRRIDAGESIEVEVTLPGIGPDRQDVHITSVGVEAGKKHDWYKLAASFGEPPTGNEPGWYKIAGALDKPPSSSTKS
jgi:hypothetical protein